MPRFFSLIAAVLAAATLHAQPFDGVLQSVESHNTTLAALRRAADAEKAAARADLTLPDPEVEFGYMWGSPSVIGSRKNFSARQSFDIATLSGARRRAAAEARRLADWQYRMGRMEILQQAYGCCLDVIYYNALLAELTVRSDNARQIAEAQKRRLDAGDATQMEYHAARLDLAAVEAETKRCTTERQAALDALALLNGGEAVSLDAAEFPAVEVPADFETWYADAEGRHPALAYARQAVEASKRQLAVSKAGRLPEFSLGFDGEYVLGERYQGITLGVSIPLWAGRGKVRQARAEKEAAEAREHDACAQFYGQMANLFRKQQGLRATADIYTKALASLDDTALLKRSLDAGQISVVEYLQAVRLYYDAVQQRLDALREWHMAYAEMTAVMW